MADSFIDFIGDRPSPSGKTQTWNVYAKGGEAPLGEVKWFGRWRCYAFFPRSDTVFERTCLRDLANFCELKTAEHRLRKHA